MDVKETFLKLTEYTIPFKSEHELRPLLPDGLIEDSVGNYYIQIGNSRTLFTSHLDTYCTKKEKVEHVFDRNFIGCTGNTTLGGDNKSGVVILMYMIEKQIPGTYYFFIGEEAFSGGRYGSQQILWKNPEFFEGKFDRCVAFDRKAYGSIVTRQSARYTSSKEFNQALIKELAKSNLEYKEDETGWYTDSATFLDVIPEVTNISNGTFNEHTSKEFVDIEYLEKVCEAACKVDWESLPVVRVAQEISTPEPAGLKYLTKPEFKKVKKLFNAVLGVMSSLQFKCLNYHQFKPGRAMIFAQWHQDFECEVKIFQNYFTIDNVKMDSKAEIYKHFGLSLADEINVEDLYFALNDFVFKNFVEEPEKEGESVDFEDFYLVGVNEMEAICDEIDLDIATLDEFLKDKTLSKDVKFLEFKNGKYYYYPFEYN